MASDPGCFCFSLLFRIRLSLSPRFSCLHGFPAVPLFRRLTAFLPARGFSCIHCSFGASSLSGLSDRLLSFRPLWV
jgi:hypothetical protein